MFSVIREITFHYGHRLMNYSGKCAHLHGHTARVQIEIQSAGLDHQGMVMDFYQIREAIGKWIQETFDHKMILCKNDPLVKALQDAGEPVVTTEENPTAEVLARWIFKEARTKHLPVSRVSLWETDNNCAVYAE